MDMMQCKAKRNNMIEVIEKLPGKAARIRMIDNTLKAFQDFVGGYIEAVTLPDGVVMICNEEGKWMGLEPNITITRDVIVGPVLFCGASGEEFADVPVSIDQLVMMLNWM